MPTVRARRVAASVTAVTAAVLPALLLGVVGVAVWREVDRGRGATVDEVRLNREATLANRELGRQIDRKLDVLLGRWPAPATNPATAPTTRP